MLYLDFKNKTKLLETSAPATFKITFIHYWILLTALFLIPLERFGSLKEKCLYIDLKSKTQLLEPSTPVTL
jgi:hypothetical protein